MTTTEAVITYGKRTAIGKFNGTLATVAAPQLGAHLVKDCLKTTGVSPDLVEEILMGQVLSAGTGQAPARQAALGGGLTSQTEALTINKVCGSGLKAVMLAQQAVLSGETHIALAGGQENMSQAPHLLMNSRSGFRFGSVEMLDHMQWDGLTNPYDGQAMGNCGDLCAKEMGFSRQEQDDFALASYEKSQGALSKGAFKEEVVSLEVPQRKKTITFDQDEEPLSVDLQKLPKLRPAFSKEGTVTAGNASTINDGAALLMVCSSQAASSHGLTPLAKIVASCSYAHEPQWFTTAPITGIKKVLAKAQMTLDQIDLFEINEAFSVVTLAAIKELGLDPKKVNVRGGAVSLGHPIGASGARILVTLIHALRQTGKKRGLASICVGGGESCNMIVEVV